MRYLKTKIVLFIVFIGVVYSCSTTKKVPENEYLLTTNNFNFSGKEKPFKAQLQEYVKQRPNSGLLFGLFPLKLLMYNSVPVKYDSTFEEYYDLTKKNRNQKSLDSLFVKNGLDEYIGKSLWLKRFRFNSGEPPNLVDTAVTTFSSENLEKFYFDRGYFDASVSASHDLDSSSKKAEVNYLINPGQVSLISSYKYEIPDTLIYRVYSQLLERRGKVIKEEDRFDANNFEEERDRIVDALKNRGYYRFNDDGNAMEFTADSTQSDKALAITLYIPKETQDSAKSIQKFYRYRYGEIHLYPDSGPVPIGQTPPEYTDTIYDGYHLHYVDSKMKYRPKFFTDAIVVRDSSLYSYNFENQTKRNIFKREGINFLGIFPEIDSTLIRNDSVLNLKLYFRPKKKYDLYYGAEMSWSEFMNFGVTPQVSLVARNLFRGGENLETTLRGTLGNVNKKFSEEGSFFNAFEMAFQTKLRFPYLLFPFNTDKVFSKRFFKQTDLRLGATVQRNIGLGRVTYTNGLDYTISFRDTHSHQISILNNEFVSNLQQDNYFSVYSGDNTIKNNFFNQYYFFYNPQAAIDHYNQVLTDDQVIDMIYADTQFQNSLNEQGLEDFSIFQNMNFRKQTITQNVFISSMSYQYILNQSERTTIKNPWYFRGRIELAGNILNLLDNAFTFYQTENQTGGQSGMVFNVPYSQFVKIDLDVRKYFYLNTNSSIATRAFIGLVQPYGNTNWIPFVRSYTAGGANDVRAWAAATLGPSDIERYEGGDDVFAIERLKFLMSAEYRFNVVSRVNGAFFIDAGNIWGTDKEDPLTLFRFDEFYKQLGIGSGFGLRFDLTYLILRLDFAYKIHDPSYEEGNRWQFDHFNPLKPRLAFGINYPF